MGPETGTKFKLMNNPDNKMKEKMESALPVLDQYHQYFGAKHLSLVTV